MDIPGFKLGRQYAEGPYCKGYNALNLSNHKTVNIQIFDPSLLNHQEFVDQFRAITDKLLGADYGVLTPTLQAAISHQRCYVISEYFPSPQQLASAEAKIPRQQALQLALQLAQTLDQLHQAGIVHGGVDHSAVHFRSPEQIALRPVILQLALPILRPGAIRSLAPAQTRYLAPEATRTPTPASDFYALGVLLYQLIFGPPQHDAPENWPCTGEHRDLEPLIRQLLQTDPTYRIHNLDQFKSALQQCRVQLPDSARPQAKSGQLQDASTTAGTTASRSTPKWLLPITGLSMAALAAILFLNLSRETTPAATKAPELAVSADAEPKQVSQVQAPARVEADPTEARPDSDRLYQQALRLLQTDPEAALDKVNLLLQQLPADLEALKLKRRIERELSARALIARAERQLQELKLLQPADDNAYASYLSLAGLLSPEDERVQLGFIRIAAACHGEAQRLLEEDRLDNAQETVDQGLSVKTDYPPLLDLRRRIAERKSALARKKSLARAEPQRRERQKTQQIARQQEAQQRETLKRQLEAEALAQRAAEQTRRQQAERVKRARLESLLVSANNHLKHHGLSLSNVFSAHQDFEQLRDLDDTDPDVRRLQKNLIEAYTILALRENSNGLYELAISALEQGAPLSPRERKKLQIKIQLSR